MKTQINNALWTVELSDPYTQMVRIAVEYPEDDPRTNQEWYWTRQQVEEMSWFLNRYLTA